MIAQELVKHTACLRYIDADGEYQAEHHAAWTARQATTDAYRRVKSMIAAGQARSFRIEHHERVFAEGEVVPANDAFSIPAMTASA